jgi:hypothetical protein
MNMPSIFKALGSISRVTNYEIKIKKIATDTSIGMEMTKKMTYLLRPLYEYLEHSAST